MVTGFELIITGQFKPTGRWKVEDSFLGQRKDIGEINDR
jgi:hypothetical protein